MAQVHKSVLAVAFHAGFVGSGSLLFVGAWFVPLFDYGFPFENAGRFSMDQGFHHLGSGALP